MSVEAMSGGSAIGVATAISTGPVISSFSNPVDLGGTHIPGFDNAAFFDTFAMPTPSLESSEGGKTIHGISPFANTEILWQVPSMAKSESAIPANNIRFYEPQIIESPSGNSPIAEFVAPINIPEPEVKTDVAVMPVEITRQEIIADAKQAIRVEDALVATGIAREEAHETALKILAEKQEKKDSIQILPKEIFFEHDAKADARREKITAIAFEQAAEKAATDGKEEITGYDLAKEMPESPQPTQIKSEIVKVGNDGSYEEFVNEIKGVASIKSDEELKQAIQRAISNNHAVKLADNSTSQKATEQEVQKVLKTGVIFENKI